MLSRASDNEVEVEAEADGAVLQAISNEMVRLFKDQFGRGPTRARTNWAGPDTITVVLEDTLTPAERNLVKMGEHQRLRDTRMFFQYAAVQEFCEPVERLTGRRVKAFASAIDTEVEGLCVETFVLHPPGAQAPSRTEKAAP
ncbi:MAG TPA: Na-translocating system protein MpsC family protein [Solirubrobacteraceae bacterium]